MSGLVVVCGLAAEAKIAAGDGVTAISSGGDTRRLSETLASLPAGTRGLLSFGVAGGLDPRLRPGDLRVGSRVITAANEHFWADDAWTTRLAAALNANKAPLFGADAPVADAAAKSAIYRRYSAACVDMETHVVARAAQRSGLPWAAVRVVTDPADRSLPHAATVGLRTDGSVDLPAILKSLVKGPRQLPGLIRTAIDARAAFAALLGCRERLGPGFAFLDL